MQLLKLAMGDPSELTARSHSYDSSWSPRSLSDTETLITSPTEIPTETPLETPTDTLRGTLLRTLHQITKPCFPYSAMEHTETLRSALILRCCFHISQGLANQPLDEISLLPPFLPDKAVNSRSALESWNSWVPLPRTTPAFCDPFLLLLSSGSGVLDQRLYISFLSTAFDDSGNDLDAFIHEVYAHHGVYDGNGKRYYCLYDNCVYNMMPVAVSHEGFEKHLKGYHGIGKGR
ncbi:hypothetical protein TWF281_007504 [Arthrobotrys megalospora]